MAYAGFSNGPNGKRIYSIQSKFNVPNGEEIRAQRALINKSRPISNGPAQLITEVWKVEAMLDLISSDCTYEDYRNLIWTIESLNWDGGYELANFKSFSSDATIAKPHYFNNPMVLTSDSYRSSAYFEKRQSFEQI